MEQQTQQMPKQVSLSEIREGVANTKQDIGFKKRLLGGYEPKEVAEYVTALKESLHHAERSFQERLEEYAAASTMVSQERDKYLKMVKEGEEKHEKLLHTIAELSKHNTELSGQVEALSENILDRSDLQEYEQALARNSAMKVLIAELEDKIAELEGKLGEAERDRYDNMKLQSANDQLESALGEMRERIVEFEKNKVLAEQFEDVVVENSLIKERCEQAMTENSRILAERNVLADQHARVSEALSRLKEENKGLRVQNTQMKLKARSIRGEFEARVFECTQNHNRNMEQIGENLKNALRLTGYEQLDVNKLLSGFEDQELLGFETSVAVDAPSQEESENGSSFVQVGLENTQ